MKEIQYAYRMTHIDNIENILNVGLVLPTSEKANPQYVPIGDVTAIDTRRHSILPNGRSIGDYIPFYFGPRTPMLYVIQHGYNNVTQRKAEEIVYCVISIDDIVRNNVPCIFTDGHALTKITTIYPGHLLKDVNKYVKYCDVYAKQWIDEPDAKRLKEAELLIESDMSPTYIRYFLVYNESARQKLLSLNIDEMKIRIAPHFYF